MFPSRFGNSQKPDFKKGILAIEVLLMSSIIAVSLVGILALSLFSLKISGLAEETIRANNIAEEAMEALRNFRDGTYWNIDGLGALTPGNDYHPEKSGSPLRWRIVLGSETVDGLFSRRIIFENARRDERDNIVESGGTIDPDAKKATIFVSWNNKGGNYEVKLATYLTNWRN